MRILLLFFIFFSTTPLGNLDRIRRSLDKMEFEKAAELLGKAQAKEPNNPGIDYLSAVLFSTDAYGKFNLDTARTLIASAIKNFDLAEEELLEDLQEDEITIKVATKLKEEIRDRIYTNMLSQLSVEKAEEFMLIYSQSPYEGLLIYKRDSIVFDRVRKNDELGIYENFLARYSSTEFREVAEKRIDELRYQVLMHSGDLHDYYEFSKKYPNTKFRNEIEQYVFTAATADHSKKSYLDFMDFASNPNLNKRAGDILYYLLGGRDLSFNHPLRDSLVKVSEKTGLQLFPALEMGKFGFHSHEGKLIVPYEFENVDEVYKCELTSDEWLFVEGKNGGRIINKSGAVLVEGVEEYEDLGAGVAKVKLQSKWYLYHKSGFRIVDEAIEDAGVLKERWIKVNRGGKWALISYSGFEITNYRFDEIYLEANYWVFERGGLKAVYTEDLIAERIHKGGLDLEFKFEDLELISDSMLIGFRDDRECMLDEDLQFLIPWGVYEINPDPSGWYLRTPEGYRLYDHSENDVMNKTHPYLETNRNWLALKGEKDWILLSRGQNIEPARGYDSLRLINEFCVFAVTHEIQELIFPGEVSISIDSTSEVKTFFNRPEYLLIDSEDAKTILDSAGRAILKGSFDEITFFNDSLLRVKKEGKNGLLNLKGVELVDISFDVIDESDGLVLCLQDGKIGCVDLSNGVVISPISETRIERIGENYLVKSEEKYGLVDSLEVSVLSYSFDEIRYWNDTSYLTRNEEEWSFLNKREEQIGESFGFLSEVVSNEKESIWKFVRGGKYGLLSNQNGFLLNPEFTDIFNIGDENEPIFFADQHLDKAGYHVVSYVNAKGDLILSKAYRKAEFDRILCDD